jgi:hypothetical protein
MQTCHCYLAEALYDSVLLGSKLAGIDVALLLPPANLASCIPQICLLVAA